MEIYIVDGRELTLEEFEALAKAAGLNTEQYKALYNVEVKQDPNATDAAAGEDKASLSPESQLANTTSGWEKWKVENPELVSRGDFEYQKKLKTYRKEVEDLTNSIKAYNENPDNIDFSNWKTVINQSEDAVKSYLAQEFPFLRAEDGTIGNAIKVQLANGEFKEIDLKPIFSGQRKQAIEVIKILNEASKLL